MARRNCKFVRKGEVLRVSRWRYGNRVAKRFSPPAWAIAVEDDDMQSGVTVIWVGRGVTDTDTYYGSAVDEGDSYSIPSPDAWPDEVCVAVAKFNMGIEP